MDEQARRSKLDHAIAHTYARTFTFSNCCAVTKRLRSIKDLGRPSKTWQRQLSTTSTTAGKALSRAPSSPRRNAAPRCACAHNEVQAVRDGFPCKNCKTTQFGGRTAQARLRGALAPPLRGKSRPIVPALEFTDGFLSAIDELRSCGHASSTDARPNSALPGLAPPM